VIAKNTQKVFAKDHAASITVCRGQAQKGWIVRGLLAGFLADTSSSATVEFALLAACTALAIVLGLMQLGGEGRAVARTLMRLRNQ